MPGEQYRDSKRPGQPGRVRLGLTALQRLAIVVLLGLYPALGVLRFRQLLPCLPRNSTVAYLRRWRRIRTRRRRRNWRCLRWLMPGAVWAIDGTCLDRPVEGRGRRALVVVEMHSRKTLALQSVSGERAVEAERVLASLVEQHGAPLVLKLDNGSAFISQRVAAFCHHHRITLMHSPIRRPRWNGTCEASGRWAKHRAMMAAAGRGDPKRLCQADLDHAVTFIGVMPRIDWALRQLFLGRFQEQLAIAAAQEGVALGSRTEDHVLRSLGRVAAKRALILCHMLTIQGREYRQCLPAPAA